MNIGQHIYIIKSEGDTYSSIAKDWTASFRRFLELLLTRLSGEKVSINEVYAHELDVKAIYSPYTMLVPVISDDLLQSPNFNEEIKTFHERAINKGYNSITWNSRIFKVLREPQKAHYLLDYLSNSRGYDFFHFNAGSDEPVLYDDFTGPTSEKTFWMRLYDLAYDVFKVMDNMKSSENELSTITHALNPITIFLAEVGADLHSQRDTLKRELIRNGYRVLPDKTMPKDMESMMKGVRADLAQSNLAIHLIGTDSGKIEGSNSSIIELQNRLATEYYNTLEKLDADVSMNFGRIIWISPESINPSVKQRLFIDNLRKDSESTHKVELLETSLEELKGLVLKKIQNGLESHDKNMVSEVVVKKTIYLIHDQPEGEKCLIIEEFLRRNGYDVVTTSFEGNPDELRATHAENLKKCDATLIYYGKENEGWIRSKQKELLKSMGMGRVKPMGPQAILIENEFQLNKSLKLNEEAMILHGSEVFCPEIIEPFLEKLKA